MASHKQPADSAWYRSRSATLVAGVVGLAIIAGLVMAVVQMSARWNTRDDGTVPATYVPEPPHFAGTASTTGTSGSSTSYPTVRLSTTDIGLPGEAPTSSGETTSGTSPSPPSSPPSPPPPATAPTFPGTFPTRVTGRPGPRINETRTLYPRP